jgi:hypothetical protein
MNMIRVCFLQGLSMDSSFTEKTGVSKKGIVIQNIADKSVWIMDFRASSYL